MGSAFSREGGPWMNPIPAQGMAPRGLRLGEGVQGCWDGMEDSRGGPVAARSGSVTSSGRGAVTAAWLPKIGNVFPPYCCSQPRGCPGTGKNLSSTIPEGMVSHVIVEK